MSNGDSTQEPSGSIPSEWAMRWNQVLLRIGKSLIVSICRAATKPACLYPSSSYTARSKVRKAAIASPSKNGRSCVAQTPVTRFTGSIQ